MSMATSLHKPDHDGAIQAVPIACNVDDDMNVEDEMRQALLSFGEPQEYISD